MRQRKVGEGVPDPRRELRAMRGDVLDAVKAMDAKVERLERYVDAQLKAVQSKLDGMVTKDVIAK